MTKQEKNWTTTERFVLLIVSAGIFFSGVLIFRAWMEGENIGEWIWLRHRHPFSWYSRPLFIIPACYFAYRRRLLLVIGFMVLLLCSLFWFPSPEVVPESFVAYLDWEKQLFFTNKSILPLTLLIFFVSGFLFSWFMAFWNRNYWLGLILINVSTILKILVSVWLAEQAGFAAVAPSIFSLAIVNLAAFLFWIFQIKRKSHK